MGLELIVFDLDNTLYPRSAGLLQDVGQRIELWLAQHMGLSPEECVALRRDYFTRYGTTMGGLVARHPELDPYEYLHFVHDLPVERYLQPDPALDAMLTAVPLRKAIYTNATTEYAWRVLHALGVAQHFGQIVGIEEVGLRNKPYLDACQTMLALLGAEGSACILVEDDVRNLAPARALGMTTILVGSTPDANVDFAVATLAEVGPLVQRLADGVGLDGGV